MQRLEEVQELPLYFRMLFLFMPNHRKLPDHCDLEEFVRISGGYPGQTVS